MTYPRFSDTEFQRRNNLARDLMQRQGLSALVIFGNSGINRHNEANVFWLTNYLDLHHNYLVFPMDGEPTLLTGLVNHVPNARAVSVIPDTRWGTYDPAKEIVAILRKNGIGKARVGLIGINATFGMGMPYQHFATMRESLPEIEWIDVTPDFSHLRVIKSDEEFDWLAKAAEFTDATVAALENETRIGMTEHDLIGIIEGSYRRKGGQPHIAFLRSMPMNAPTACVPAQNVTDRVIQKGDVIIMEISASYWGYSGQIHRPIAVGRDPTPEWQKLLDVGEQAYSRICKAICPGATEGDVIKAASVIGESGYRIYDDLIHGYGVDIHPPIIDQSCCEYWNSVKPIPAGRMFAEDMAMVVQPNPITPDERMGLQVGALTRVTKGGAVSLQKYPMKFVVAQG
ncbi:MAG TPA: M24 family metallopeptidase [Anaerolineales bacterium]|nr:M24 family metallopeptidase [Anaerolineales bacterium]